MISDTITLRFCALCETDIQTGGLCSYGCPEDANPEDSRPTKLVMYRRIVDDAAAQSHAQ